jgi:hypothetical protein
MLKPIIDSPVLGFPNQNPFPANSRLTAFQSLSVARILHQTLLDEPSMITREKSILARQISGHLFATEADHILPDLCRAFFVRLRTDAYQRAASMDSMRLPHQDRIYDGYDTIADGVRYSM